MSILPLLVSMGRRSALERARRPAGNNVTNRASGRKRDGVKYEVVSAKSEVPLAE